MTDTITLRDLRAEDKEAALAILHACYPGVQRYFDEFIDRFDASLDPPKGTYAVSYIGAFENNKLVGIGGYAQSSMTDAYWELSWGTVSPEKQGMGIGKKLIDYRFKKILERTTTPKTYVMIATKPTRLYVDAGFKRIATSDEAADAKQVLCMQLD